MKKFTAITGKGGEVSQNQFSPKSPFTKNLYLTPHKLKASHSRRLSVCREDDIQYLTHKCVYEAHVYEVASPLYPRTCGPEPDSDSLCHECHGPPKPNRIPSGWHNIILRKCLPFEWPTIYDSEMTTRSAGSGRVFRRFDRCSFDEEVHIV